MQQVGGYLVDASKKKLSVFSVICLPMLLHKQLCREVEQRQEQVSAPKAAGVA